ncbi:MAG: hypothetical protein ACK52W_06655 [Alphaproteobacteria bacterium]
MTQESAVKKWLQKVNSDLEFRNRTAAEDVMKYAEKTSFGVYKVEFQVGDSEPQRIIKMITDRPDAAAGLQLAQLPVYLSANGALSKPPYAQSGKPVLIVWLNKNYYPARHGKNSFFDALMSDQEAPNMIHRLGEKYDIDLACCLYAPPEMRGSKTPVALIIAAGNDRARQTLLTTINQELGHAMEKWNHQKRPPYIG